MSLESNSRSRYLQFGTVQIPDARCSDREQSVPDLSSCPPNKVGVDKMSPLEKATLQNKRK